MERLGIGPLDDDNQKERRADARLMRDGMTKLIDRLEALEKTQHEVSKSIDSITWAMNVALGIDIKNPASISAKAAEVAVIQRAGRIGIGAFTLFCGALIVGVITLVARSDLLTFR